MSEISLKSITGITSITTPAGVDNQLTLHNNNTTEAVKVDTAGNVHVNNQLSIAGVSTFSEDVKFVGATSGRDVQWDKSANYLRFKDNAFATFGNSDDLFIYHDGNHSQIRDVGTGHLILGGTHLYLTDGSGSEYFLQCIANNQVDLYFNNSIKLSTTSTGISVTGSTTSTVSSHNTAMLTLTANMGTYNNRSLVISSPVTDSSHNPFRFQTSNAFEFQVDGARTLFIHESGRIDLHHDGSTDAKLSTSSTGINISGDLTLTDTTADSAAGPELKLYRNSASPADADYIGQIKFAGESDTGVERNYAKITGKILDASNGTEDGIIEFAHIKAGSQNISARFRSDSLQLLNNTNFSVAGDTTLTGDLDVDGHTDLDNVSIVGVTTFATSVHLNTSSDPAPTRLLNIAHATSSSPLVRIYNSHASGRQVQIEYKNTQSSFNQGIQQGSPHGFVTFSINPRPISFWNSSLERLRVESSGNVSIFYDLDVDGHTNLDNVSISGIVTASQGLRVPNGSDSSNYISVGNGGGLRLWGTSHQFADIRSGNLHFRNTSLQNILELQQDKDIFLYGPSYFLDTARFDSTVTIADSIIHFGDTDTKIRFPSADQISFETGGSERGRFDNDGNFLIGTTSHGNAGSGARHLVISGPSNQGLTINSTSTSGIYRDCNIYFGYGTSTTDMAKGQLTYSGNGDYFHMSVGNSSYTLARSFRLNGDGTVRFDSTHTNANSMSLVIKSHKARALNDNNGIVFRDANDHTQAVINVTKMSTSDATSDLVFRTSSGQVVNTLQGIPERMRIKSDGHVLPAITNTQDLGSSSKRWRNVYTTDLQLSNEGKTNDVDNTWGDYTIQEGESDLFLINNRNGKKYKFNLTEVS